MEEELVLPSMGMMITERCTLHCKLCGEFSPYRTQEAQQSKENIRKCVDEVFHIVDRVGNISFSGGEPLVHKDLWEMVTYLEPYIDRIERVLILTNGTLLPNADQFLALKKYPQIWKKLKFHVSDYGLDKSVRAEELENFLQAEGVECRMIRYHGDQVFCDGWIDYGDNTQRFFSEEDILKNVQKCAFRKKPYTCVNSSRYIARCGRAIRRWQLGIIPANSKDIVDLLADKTRDEKRYELKKLLSAPAGDACAYCSGMREDSERFPAAEQLTKEEIECIAHGARFYAEVREMMKQKTERIE